jgi:pimeloyl-ACP methyl ester carboxylesterase
MAADAIGLLNVVGARDAHVVGASMGGMIAQELAIHWPHRVKSLTSIMSTTGDPGLPRPKPETLAIFMAPPPRTSDEYIEANVKAWRLLRNGQFPEEAPRDRARATRAAARGFEAEGGARQMVAILASGSRKAALAGVKAPTLVIHGADDPLVPLAAGEDTARSIPNAKLVVIERMGHTLPRAVWPRALDEIAAIAR